MADPDSGTSNSSTGDWREMRRAERRARRAARQAVGNGPHEHGGPAIGGLILLGLGVVLLAGHFGLHLPERWWAALLLIPAGGALVAAIRAYRVDGRLTGRVMGPLGGGIFFLVLACGLYFGADWSLFLPVLLILIGAGAIARTYWLRD